MTYFNFVPETGMSSNACFRVNEAAANIFQADESDFNTIMIR